LEFSKVSKRGPGSGLAWVCELERAGGGKWSGDPRKEAKKERRRDGLREDALPSWQEVWGCEFSEERSHRPVISFFSPLSSLLLLA
jgi:hypothetical protein